MTNSRDKGCRGEREVAELLRARGWPARRGQQHSGSPDSPDVAGGPPGWHIEVKRVEALRLYPAMAQAIRDAGADQTPVVLHRPNGREWVAILRLDDWLDLVGDPPPAGPPSWLD